MPTNEKPKVSLPKGRTLPNNLEAEQALLSCLLVDADLALEIVPSLSEDDFYSQIHKQIFVAMQEINLRSSPIELATLTDELERKGKMASIGGINYLVNLTTMVPSSANHKYYLEIVKRNSIMRKLIHSCSDIIEQAYTSEDGELTVAGAEKQIFDINQGNLSGKITPLSESVAEVFDRAEKMQSNPNYFRGITTGFRQFDRKTNGFQKGNLVILAALTGVGKSAMAINIMEHVAKQGKNIAYFSLEMPKREIAQRIVCSLSGVSMSAVTAGNLDKETDWVHLWEANELISKMNVFLDDSSLNTTAEIRSKCIRLKARYGLDFVIIDYLQLMNSSKKSESRQQEIADITRNLKIIAKELGVPILALSQLSREAAKRNVKEGKEPVLSDLRESGAIEQDADMVLFIYKKNEEEQPLAGVPIDVDLIIAKNRNGPTDKIPLKWIGELVRFVNVEDEHNLQKIHKPTEADELNQDLDNVPLPDQAPPEELEY